jgi:hypothetical protein
VGVCRVAESEGKAIDFGDLVPLDCVLRRVSEELFNLSFPALNTWRTLRDRMATEGVVGPWSVPRTYLRGFRRGTRVVVQRRKLRQSLGRQGLWALTTPGPSGLTCPR